MLPLKKILCPTDFSEASYTALEHAVELALHFDAELHVLHFIPFAAVSPPDLMAVAAVVPDNDRLQMAENLLRDVVTTRIPAGVRVRSEVKMGYADKEIASAAFDQHADLLVIATHGLTGWRHLVFGSVAEAIVRASHCPVLTVHAKPARMADVTTH